MSNKSFFYLVGLILGLVILVVTQIPGVGTKLVVCDVGQGDAILITRGRNQVLIDGGPSSEKIMSCLESYVSFYDRTIELIVLTNTDFDHMNGLSRVLDSYHVMQFVTADGVHSSDALYKFIDKLQVNGVGVIGVERGDNILVGSKDSSSALEFQVLWPPDTNDEYVAILSNQLRMSEREQILGASANRGDLNERSVAMLLLGDKRSVLLTGDIGFQAEKELLKMGNLPDIDYLKVGHHGSRYASSLEFLQAIKPELAIISAGVKNRYGHPTAETLERLEQVGAKVRRTDQEGMIVIEL